MLPKYPALTKASYHLKGSTLEERVFANEAICIDSIDIDSRICKQVKLTRFGVKTISISALRPSARPLHLFGDFRIRVYITYVCPDCN